MRAVYVSAGRAQWLETCRALTRLPALQSFVLILENSWFCEPVEKLPVFLEPLRGLRVNRPRCVNTEQSLSEGSSSDGESSASSSSGSSTGMSLRPPTSARACSCRLLTDISKTAPFIKEDSGQTTWELRLQGQSYYAHELWRIGEDLRRRGIDCCISTA